MPKLIPIKTFLHRHEAEGAQGLLKEQGIVSIISADDAGGQYPGASLGMGNVKLLIQESDIPKAKECLQVLDTVVEGELWEEDMTVADLPEVKSIPDKTTSKNKSNRWWLALAGGLIVCAGIIYLLFLQPYNGVYREFYPNGIVWWEGTFKSGKMNGVFKEYFNDGHLHREATMIDDQGQGNDKEYYLNGQLKWEYPYANGKLDGQSKVYYENGQLKSEATYKNGLLHGLAKEYYENGNLKSEQAFINDEPEGFYKSYYENGEPWETLNHQNGRMLDAKGQPVNGIHKSFYPDGVLESEWSYKNGKEDGPSIEYYRIGTIKRVENFKDGKCHGLAIENYENGTPRYKYTCKNNEVIKYEEYNKEGKLVFYSQ